MAYTITNLYKDSNQVVGKTGGYQYTAWQQFTTVGAGFIDYIKLYFNISTGSPSGGFEIEIWTDNGSDRPESLIGTSSSITPTVNSENTFNFITRPSVSATTKYFLATKIGTQTNENYWNIGRDLSNHYAGGKFVLKENSTYITQSDRDVYFVVSVADSSGAGQFMSCNRGYW